jgi:hypothetical protein
MPTPVKGVGRSSYFRSPYSLEERKQHAELQARIAREENWQTPEIVPVCELPPGERFSTQPDHHTKEGDRK